MRTGGTISILFTDIVGSTELLSRLGDAKWDAARRASARSMLLGAVSDAGADRGPCQDRARRLDQTTGE
jgi:hypothetical protein